MSGPLSLRRYFLHGVEYQLSLRSDEADRLARELTAETGETLTEAVETALRERLDRERARHAASMRTRLAAAGRAVTAPMEPRAAWDRPDVPSVRPDTRWQHTGASILGSLTCSMVSWMGVRQPGLSVPALPSDSGSSEQGVRFPQAGG
jgi:antitoxin VapB